MKITSLITTLLVFMIFCSGTSRAQAPSYPQENEQLEFATQLLSQSEYQFAASSYVDFIRQFPHSALLPKAYVGAGDSLFFLKEPDKALEYYQQYENQFPNGKEKWLVLLREAQCLYLDGKTDEVLNKLSSINLDSIQAPFGQTYYFYLGTVLMDKGRLREAGEAYEKVIAEKASSEYATLSYLRLAAILSRVGAKKQAVEIYDNALQSGDSLETRAQMESLQGMAYLQSHQYDMAAVTFENITDHYPTSRVAKDAAVNWFIALLKNNQADELIAQYHQRFKSDFDDPLNGPIHLLAVDALLKQKDNDEALSILNNLLAAPEMSQKIKGEATLKKAGIMALSGQFDAALKLVNAQTSPDKDTQVSLDLIKGQSYLGLHDYDKAWEIFSKVAQENPNNATAYCSQAHIREEQGQNFQAASLFMECYNKAKDESYRQDALFSAFLMFEKANRIDDTIKTSELYKTNYPQGPHSYEIILNLADLHSQNKEYDQAIDLLKTLSIAPYQYQREALFEVAYNLQLEGKTQDALKLYGIIISQNTDLQLTLMSLKNSAMIYSQNNDQDKAAETMTTIVLNYPDNDLPSGTYLWLLEYWKQKHDLKVMSDVLAMVKKRPDIYESIPGELKEIK